MTNKYKINFVDDDKQYTLFEFDSLEILDSFTEKYLSMGELLEEYNDIYGKNLKNGSLIVSHDNKTSPVLYSADMFDKNDVKIKLESYLLASVDRIKRTPLIHMNIGFINDLSEENIYTLTPNQVRFAVQVYFKKEHYSTYRYIYFLLLEQGIKVKRRQEQISERKFISNDQGNFFKGFYTEDEYLMSLIEEGNIDEIAKHYDLDTLPRITFSKDDGPHFNNDRNIFDGHGYRGKSK